VMPAEANVLTDKAARAKAIFLMFIIFPLNFLNQRY
jgi:hypothetical protein